MRTMSKHMFGRFLLTVIVTAACSAMAMAQTAVQGVWKVTERTTTGQNAGTNKSPQPGYYIFTPKHYSIMFVSSTAPRPDLPADASKATDKQIRDAWQPFTANSGTYEVKGSEITIRPLVAKNPNFMKPKNFQILTFRVDGNTLTVTLKANQDGPINDAATVKLMRVE